MVVIGLTGGIGSGKSTVSQMLSSLGARILDADIIARDLVRPGRPAWKRIVKHFGPGFLLENGEIDRPKLGRKVFSDPEARLALNRLTHPRVYSRIAAMLRRMSRVEPGGVAVVDAPLLIEAGLDRLVDEIWVVRANQEVRVERVMKRDRSSREDAQKRLASQMPDEELLGWADRVIDNDGSVERTREQVLSYWGELQRTCDGKGESGQRRPVEGGGGAG